MEEFSTSLVREKIIFIDGETEKKGSSGKEPIVIRSNRVFLKLGKAEKAVVRAQNMHTTLRLAGKIFSIYHEEGSILDHEGPFDWEPLWEESSSDYERKYNPENWAAVYINGKSVFKTKMSPFVDVIEKCALLSLDNYDGTMEVTENALKQIGHAVRINHSSNVAAVFTDGGDSMRCGIIHRSGGKDRTFSFSVSGGKQPVRIAKSFGITAAYLDAFHLQFAIRSLRQKIAKGDAKAVSPESSQVRAAIARQSAINKAILAFEEKYEVKYRPLRPDLFSDL